MRTSPPRTFPFPNPVALVGVLAALLAPAAAAQNRQIELEWLRNAGCIDAGTIPGVSAGFKSICAGDVNGDGYDDLLVAAPLASPVGTECGQAWIVYGGPGLTGDLSLASADVTLNGSFNSFGNLGQSIAAPGDVNQDGYDDVLLGAPNEKPNGTGSGQAYLLYGGPSLPATISMAAMGALGVTFNGWDFSDLAGFAVAGPGDVNGDLFPDVAIGAPGSNHGGVNFAGETYVVYGGNALPSVVQLSGLTAGTGCMIRGIATSDQSADQLGRAGDFNGDGYADVLIGAHNADPSGKVTAGQAYLVFGGPALPAVIALSTLGSAGITFNGAIASDALGTALGPAGDVNGDGRDDILLASPLNDIAGLDAGMVYLVWGSAALSGSQNVQSLGANAMTIAGPEAGMRLASSVDGGGDVNRDGLDDFVLGNLGGHPNGDNAAGEAYLVYGKTAGWGASLNLAALNAGGVVFAGIDALDNAGASVSVRGDVNDDGFDDVVITAPRGDAGGLDAGETIVAYGAPHFLQAVGPAASGGALNLRAHGAASQPMELLYSPFLIVGGPLETGLGPFWLGLPFFEAPFGNFGSNGEFQIALPLPPTGIAGLTLHMQFLGKPQGQHLDLTYLLSVTFD